MGHVSWGTAAGALLLFVAPGTMAYRGYRFPRTWREPRRPTWLFGLLWLGVGGELAVLVNSGVLSRVGVLVVGAVMALSWLVGILSWFWLPGFLLPRWYREGRSFTVVRLDRRR